MDRKREGAPQRNWYIALRIINGADRLSAVSKDQTTKGLRFGRAKEIAKAFGDVLSLQAMKFLIERELFLECIADFGGGP